MQASTAKPPLVAFAAPQQTAFKGLDDEYQLDNWRRLQASRVPQAPRLRRLSGGAMKGRTQRATTLRM